jgi:hypothetical protein
MDKLDNIAQEIIQLIGDEWIKQGHDLTGAFVQGLSYEIVDNIIYIYDTTNSGYGKILNAGVSADRIPFTTNSERSERGWEKSPFKTSKYIQGLVLYAKLRKGANDKDALSIAFAIAHTQKKEGMPTKDSARFSKTGKRTQFVEDATTDVDKIVEKYMDQFVNELIEV